MKRKFVQMVAALAMGMMPWVAQAWKVVFDPKNFAKNAVEAAEAIKQTQNQNRAYEMDLRRFLSDLKHLERMGRGEMELRDIQRILRTVVSYDQSLSRLLGSVQESRTTVENRYRQVLASGLSWDEYYRREQEFARTQGEERMVVFENERRALARVNEDYETVLRLQSQIDAPEGLLESQQTMNQHLNLMAAQNAHLIELIAGKQALDNEDIYAQKRREEEAQRAMEERARRQQHANERARASFRALSDGH